MGSFNFTCSVSNLPIMHGTPVRWIAMGTAPEDNLGSYVHTLYSPLTIPIKAKYNDYGSIEGYNEDSIGYISNLSILNNNSIEVGIGDNRSHDVKVEKGMPFKEWLNAIWEYRVKSKRTRVLTVEELAVRQKKLDAFNSIKYDDGTPNVKIIEHKLKGAGFSDFYPSDVSIGLVRVRNDRYSDDDEILIKAQEFLSKDYIAVITPSSDNYGSGKEIAVFPKENRFHYNYSNKYNSSFLVKQSMIREDVWQYLLDYSFKSYNGNVNDLSRVNEYVRKKLNSLEEREIPRFFETMSYSNIGVNWFCNGNLSDDAKEDFTKELIELIKVENTLSAIRKGWAPGNTIGGQELEFDLHEMFFEGMLNLTKKTREDYEEYVNS